MSLVHLVVTVYDLREQTLPRGFTGYGYTGCPVKKYMQL